jgi:hypothetical protein
MCGRIVWINGSVVWEMRIWKRSWILGFGVVECCCVFRRDGSLDPVRVRLTGRPGNGVVSGSRCVLTVDGKPQILPPSQIT